MVDRENRLTCHYHRCHPRPLTVRPEHIVTAANLIKQKTNEMRSHSVLKLAFHSQSSSLSFSRTSTKVSLRLSKKINMGDGESEGLVGKSSTYKGLGKWLCG